MQKIFISSTFRDMQAERDEMQKNIVPRLRAMARKYGEDVEVCDLRWGVNTAELDGEAGAKKVLSVCLEEIDKCRPYMLVLLGDRYGWIPDGKLLQNTAKRKGLSLSDHELEKSVTALEIEYGALKDPECLEKTIFMFREPLTEASEDYLSRDEEYAKLMELKDRIRELAGDRVFSYRVKWDEEKKRPVGMEQFADIVIKQMSLLLEKEWKKNGESYGFRMERKKHWSWVENKAAMFGGRKELLEKYKEKLQSGNHCLLLTGNAGSGKSTLCAKLISDYNYIAKGWYVIPFICGSGGQGNSGIDVLQYWVSSLEENLDVYQRKEYMEMLERDPNAESAEDSWVYWSIRRDLLLNRYYNSEKRPVLFAVVGVDKLEQDSRTKEFRFIPSIKNKNLYILASCDSDYDTERFVGKRLALPQMRANEKEEIICGMMKYYDKEIDKEVMGEIVRKESSDKPLYLSLLTQCLLAFDQEDFGEITAGGNDMSAITRYQKQFVQALPEGEVELSQSIFRKLWQDENTEFIPSVIEYIAASRFGLREHDLEQLLERRQISWSSLEFSRLVYFISHFFEERDGQFDFSSAALKESLRSRIDLKSREKEIFEYIKTLPLGDELKTDEMVYYCCLADEKDYLIEYIIACVEAVAEEVISEDVIKKTAHDIFMKEIFPCFSAAILEIEEPDKVLRLLAFCDEWVMSRIHHQGNRNLETADALCNILLEATAKFIDTDQEGVFSYANHALMLQKGIVNFERRQYREAYNIFIEAAHKALARYNIHGKREYRYLSGKGFKWAGKTCEKWLKSDSEEIYNSYKDAADIFYKMLQEEYDETVSLDLCMMRYKQAVGLWQQGQYDEAEDFCHEFVGQLTLAGNCNPDKIIDLEYRIAYRNVCEILCHIYWTNKRSEELKEMYPMVENMGRDIFNDIPNPVAARECAADLENFGAICKNVNYLPGVLRSCKLKQSILRWAVDNGGGDKCIIKYYEGCFELGNFFYENKDTDSALRYFLKELGYRRRFLGEYPYLENAIKYSEHCKLVGDILMEKGFLWDAMEVYRQGYDCFRRIECKESSIAGMYSQVLEEMYMNVGKIIQPHKYTEEELTRQFNLVLKRLGWDKEFQW